MQGSPHSLELLAPARNLSCGISAIDHGADAVYIGGPRFGARAAAGNSLADIEKLVVHGHRFRARVYVALNTILDDRDLPRAVALCHQLHAIGVDALIIQDLGLLESELPPLPLHSSTQMNNRTAEKVRFLEKVGFQQVVLARELSLERIREIRSATTVPLEFFVHGALCVSYSGQCFISEVMAGRSANRGECAQFCRHCFSLYDHDGQLLKKDRYLLSLKDLNLSLYLRKLIDVGIRSFKIEGRLKDENYVKNVTAFYRHQLDKIIEADPRLSSSSSGHCRFDFTPDPAKSFNRQTTDYFLVKRRNRPGAIDSPKATGQLLGRVVRSEKGYFVLDTTLQIANGDGLCFFDGDRRLRGIRVNRVDGPRIYAKDFVSPGEGTVVYRNSDVAFNKLLARSSGCRTIDLQLQIKEVADGLLLLIRDEDGIESETALAVKKEKARQSGMAAELADRQLRKTGGSVFSVIDLTVELDPELFLPAALFNELRRKGFGRHEEKRLLIYRRALGERVANDFPWPESEVSYLDNIGNSRAEQFYRRHGVQLIDRGRLCAADVEDAALMTTRYCVRAQLKMCPAMAGGKGMVAEPLTLVDKTGSYTLLFDCKKCEMTVTRKGEEKGRRK